MRETALELLWDNVRNLKSSVKWLRRSYNACQAYGLKIAYSEEEHFPETKTLNRRLCP